MHRAHSLDRIELVALLFEMGLSQRQIAKLVDLRGTVQQWLARGLPNYASAAPGAELDAIARLPAGPYSYVLGLYLGDGYIARFSRTTQLRIFFDSRHPAMIGECIRALRQLDIGRARALRRRGVNCVVVYSSSSVWPSVFPQHGAGPKHERPIDLADWQRAMTTAHPRELLRGFIQSDGCRFMNPVVIRGRRYAYPRYLFSNVSEDIKRIFCEHLDLLGIEWRRVGDRAISVARRDSVAKLDEFVGPKR